MSRLWYRFVLLNSWSDGRVDGLADGPHVWGFGGVPWQFALLIVGLDLLGLGKGGEAIVALVPEGSIVVSAKFFIEVYVA